MNSLTIIGNVVRDAEPRTTQAGISVCSFTVAVNKKYSKSGENRNENDATFFKVTAWRKLAENCGKFVKKGMKVSVVGPVDVEIYTTEKGETRANLVVTADDVEFLTRVDGGNGGTQQNNYSAPEPQAEAPQASIPQGFVAVDDESDLPF